MGIKLLEERVHIKYEALILLKIKAKWVQQ